MIIAHYSTLKVSSLNKFTQPQLVTKVIVSFREYIHFPES